VGAPVRPGADVAQGRKVIECEHVGNRFHRTWNQQPANEVRSVNYRFFDLIAFIPTGLCPSSSLGLVEPRHNKRRTG
jgi:hypothetical protein